MWGLCILMSLSHAFGQYQQLAPTFPSPNATGLGTYGEIPVSLFTGVPEISIPLYEVKGKRLSLPINLSYHAVGNRPWAMPGWVGNGWSLMAGGVITRKQNGLADELSQSGAFAGFKAGYYFNYANLSGSDWSSSAKLSANTAFPNNNAGGSGAMQEADSQPDEFLFNFGKFSGSFYLDHTGQWQVRSDKYLKVVFNAADFATPFTLTDNFRMVAGTLASNVIRPFGKFTIIDGEGNQYVFGSLDPYNTAIEFSDGMIPISLGFGTGLTATSWYLTQVISGDGVEKINLTYERGPLISAMGYSYSSGFTSAAGNGALNPGCTIPQDGDGAPRVQGRVIFPVYLTKIEMPSMDVAVDFSSKAFSFGLCHSLEDYTRVYRDAGLIFGGNTDQDFPSKYLRLTGSAIPYYNGLTTDALYKKFVWLKLMNFNVTNAAGTRLKTFSFGYNDNMAPSSVRLQLKSLTMGTGDFAAVQKYSFGYNTTTLPPLISTITDHWGFNNMVSIPVGNFNFEALRQPDLTGVNTQAEILTSITYPTGGTTTFTYENNKYSGIINRSNGPGVVTETGTAGGLRIRKITNNDGYDNLTSKEYYYVKGYTSTVDVSTLVSSGICDSKPMYNLVTTGVDLNGTPYTYGYNSATSVVPLTSSSMGSFIGYSTVVEKNSNGGYSVYNFSNHDNGYADEAAVNTHNKTSATYFAFNSLAFKRGLLLNKSDYTSSGAIVSEEINTYSSTVRTYPGFSMPTVVRAVFARAFNVCPSAARTTVSRSAYLLHTYPFVPETKTVRNYASDGSGTFAATVTTFNYDQYINLLEQKVINSLKDPVSVINRYNPEFAGTTSGDGNIYRNMMDKNIVSALVEQERMMTKDSKRITVGSDIFTYKQFTSDRYSRDRHYVMEMANPVEYKLAPVFDVLSATGNLKFNGTYYLKEVYNYDQNGNLSNIEELGRNKSFIWDYRGALPVAKVTDASNIYESGKTGNPVVSRSTSIFIPFELNKNVFTYVPVGGTPRTIKLTFSYNYNGLTGTNNSTINWGISGPGYSNSGNVCTYPTSSVNSCGGATNIANVSGMPPGTYLLSANVLSCVGYQNYYGYFMNIDFTDSRYAVVDRKKEIAYSSFEYASQADLDAGTGGIDGITLAALSNGTTVTGSKFLNLTADGITIDNLVTSNYYTVSYWSKDGAYDVNGTTPILAGPVKANTSWKYYQHQVTVGTSKIVIKGTGAVDEVRVYPRTSSMETYTYAPQTGITSACSVNNTITYYGYDAFGRLSTEADQDGNIVKTYDYSYKN